MNDENKVRQRFPRTRMPPWRARQSCQRRHEISRLLCGWRAQVADRDARGTVHDRLTEFNQIEQTVLDRPAIAEMEASILPATLHILDGQEGFPALP